MQIKNIAVLSLIFLLILIKIIAIYTTNFNLFGDEAQYWIWSKSFDFVYFSKPPLLAWFLGIYTFLFGGVCGFPWLPLGALGFSLAALLGDFGPLWSILGPL